MLLLLPAGTHSGLNMCPKITLTTDPQSNKPLLSFRGQQSHQPAVRPHLNTMFPPKNHPLSQKHPLYQTPAAVSWMILKRRRYEEPDHSLMSGTALQSQPLQFFFFVADQSCFLFLRVTCWLSPVFFFPPIVSGEQISRN